MDTSNALREHLLELLEGKSAHLDLASVMKKFPVGEINTRLAGAPHTAWQLLKHLQIAQWDIVEFSLNENHISPKFPDGLWVRTEGTEAEWQECCEQISNDLQTMRDLVSDEKTDLFAKIPHGTGQTILREALLTADHNAYHLGQIVFLMKTLEGENNAPS